MMHWGSYLNYTDSTAKLSILSPGTAIPSDILATGYSDLDTPSDTVKLHGLIAVSVE